MHSSVLLAELVVVREWLHETAPQPQHPQATIGYWTFTKHNVMQALRTRLGIFHINHGELQVSAVRHYLSGELSPSSNETPTQRIAGKPTSKMMAIYMGKSSSESLASCPQTFSVLKSACRTWEDHLWAQIGILCEEKQTAEMIKLGGSFWDGGLAVLEIMPSPPSQEEDTDEAEEWEREATSTSQSRRRPRRPRIPRLSAGHHPRSDKFIKLETFATGLRDGNFDLESSEHPTMTRFFAHLCLYLWMIDIPVRPLATKSFSRLTYKCWKPTRVDRHVCRRARRQRSRAICDVLELTADVNERRSGLTRAREHGLDFHRVAIVTAERTIDRAFELLPQMKGPLPSVIALQGTPSDVESLLLRSIEWTTFEDGTYDTALEQATVILWHFLGAGRVSLVKNLVEMLPRKLASIGQPEERATEYLHYSSSSQSGTVLTGAAWSSDYKGLIDQAYDAIVKLLTSDWMMPDETGDRRSRELSRAYTATARHALRLSRACPRVSMSSNLKRALELANIVADSMYKLYVDFLHLDGRRLGEYLDAVRRATIAGLEGGGSDPFKTIPS
ncbi:hypothetical protein BDR05DRAFT_1004738 [Suillus weaverae]|nr:hypothetical protein BDR05DRAFT_1004738 [Suillus weaverae]